MGYVSALRCLPDFRRDELAFAYDVIAVLSESEIELKAAEATC